MAQQTAVEWLKNQILTSNGLENLIGNIDNWIEQAKQMEKEQIIKAHTRAYLIGEDNISIEIANERSEQYYNETYTTN
jgi:hypothetical protein